MAGPGNINIKVGADTNEAVAGLSRVNSELGKTQTAGQKFGSGIKSATLPAIGALTAIGGAAIYAGKQASNLNESTNAVRVSFGSAAPMIEKFAKGASAMGLSTRAAQEALVPMGANLQNVGFSAEQAATSSISLTKRAADMASVFNTDVSTALEAINSGLRGESDPLEQFGVGLSAAAVQAHAMSMGLAASTSALTAQDLAQARVALILEQTNKLQGDFVATSGEAANAARVNAAESENLAASYGQAVLPAMKLYQAALAATLGFLGEHKTLTVAVAGVIGTLAAAVLVIRAGMIAYTAATVAWTAATTVARAATVVWTAAQWLLNVALTANPVGLVVVAIAALTAGIYLAYTRSETFRNAVSTLWTILRNTPLGIVISHMDNLAAAVMRVVSAVQSLVSWIGNIKFPSPPSWLGKLGGLNPFRSAARPPVGASSSPRSLIRGAPRASGPAGAGGSGESITINVHGAIDPEGTARAIERVLAGHRRRQRFAT